MYKSSITGSLSDTTTASDDSQQSLQAISRATAIGAAPGVVGFDQGEECLPRHHLLHHRKKLLTLGALLGRGLLVGDKFEVLVIDEPKPYKKIQRNCPTIRGAYTVLHQSFNMGKSKIVPSSSQKRITIILRIRP